MDKIEISEILKKQRAFFQDGSTRNISLRLNALERLEEVIKAHEDDVLDALRLDLGKSRQEAYMCEYGLALSELTFMKKNLAKFAKARKAKTPITNFAAESYIMPIPYGNVLVMSPWNYPFLLSMEPVIDALAAGNTVVIKPSAYSPYTSDIIKTIIEEAFETEYVAVVIGGREENKDLLDEKFDYIFFTGSQNVGKTVMAAAAKHLTPITLELGGKSPCIIDKSANIMLAARRVVFGKYLNCGQTCVAPDYILCHEDVKDEFVKAVKYQIKRQFGAKPLNNNAYGKIINEKHYNRLARLLDDAADRVYGGVRDLERLKISPAIIDDASYNDAVMKEEIFGPIMPIITFRSIKSVVHNINKGAKPLALYVFADDKRISDYVMRYAIHGGGCINDTIMHLATSSLPFGGVAESGMGSYHGKSGFETFSHLKSVVDKKNFIDIDLRYQPYNFMKLFVIKKLLK